MSSLGEVLGRVTGLGWAGVVALGVAGVVVVVELAGVARTLAGGGVDDERVRSDAARAMVAWEEGLSREGERLDGRSMFFVPPPPPPPPPPPRPEPEPRPDPEPEPEPDPGPPPPPSRYGGPEIVAMMGEVVWFDDGERRAAGAEAVRGVGVVETRPPWSAVLSWRGGEYEVEFWERTTGDLMTNPPEGGASFRGGVSGAGRGEGGPGGGEEL